MLLNMLFRICIVLPFCAVFLYLLLGILTTGWLRASNPFKRLPRSSQTLYLTFDDGVNPVYTPMLLDLLKKNNIKASFFILASSAKEYPQLLQRMKKDGHLVGFHSFHHRNQILQLPHQLIQDFEKSMKIFDDMGMELAYYRPPWGHVRPLGLCLCKKYGLKTVLWNVIVQDWQANTTVQILCDKLTKKVQGNAVICLHDGRGKNEAPLKTIQALANMIPKWKGDGHTFETVDCLY